MAADTRPMPCQVPDAGVRSWWTSDDPARRAFAAALCTGCRRLNACGRDARRIRATFGVWAGRDVALVAQRRRQLATSDLAPPADPSITSPTTRRTA